jgi:hypothetical protein
MKFSHRKIFHIFCNNLSQVIATETIGLSFIYLATMAKRSPRFFIGRTIHGPDGQGYLVFFVTDISAPKHIEQHLREINAPGGASDGN